MIYLHLHDCALSCSPIVARTEVLAGRATLLDDLPHRPGGYRIADDDDGDQLHRLLQSRAILCDRKRKLLY